MNMKMKQVNHLVEKQVQQQVLRGVKDQSTDMVRDKATMAHAWGTAMSYVSAKAREDLPRRSNPKKTLKGLETVDTQTMKPIRGLAVSLLIEIVVDHYMEYELKRRLYSTDFEPTRRMDSTSTLVFDAAEEFNPFPATTKDVNGERT